MKNKLWEDLLLVRSENAASVTFCEVVKIWFLSPCHEEWQLWSVWQTMASVQEAPLPPPRRHPISPGEAAHTSTPNKRKFNTNVGHPWIHRPKTPGRLWQTYCFLLCMLFSHPGSLFLQFLFVLVTISNKMCSVFLEVLQGPPNPCYILKS